VREKHRGLRHGLVEAAPGLALFLVLVLPHLSFVPLWDGRSYVECIDAGLRAGLNPLNFNCFGHPTMMYMTILALGQALSPGSAFLLHSTNILLGLVSIAALAQVLRRVLPGSEWRVERILAVSIYAVYPALAANCLNLNPDYGVLVFFLVTMALLVSGRFAWAALAAAFLVYSKETGLLLYLLMMGLYLAIYVLPGPGPWKHRVRQALRRSMFFSPALFFAGIALLRASGPEPARWQGSGGLADLLKVFFFPSVRAALNNPYYLSVLDINFAWILSLALGAALVVLLARILRRRPMSFPEGDRRGMLFVVLLFVGTFYLLTRFQTYVTLRYLLPIYPLFFATALFALGFLTRRAWARRGVLAAAALLMFASNYRTIDPVSRAVFGTWRFGDRPILEMTSLTGECCGYGRDQLVYDLEYTKFDDVQNEIYEALRPTPETTIVMPTLADYYLAGPLDRRTFHRTLRLTNVFMPRYGLAVPFLHRPRKPEEIYFVGYPNFAYRGELALIEKLYAVEWKREFGSRGYTVPVWKMRLRPEPPGRAPQL
jgi:hypothetical protein